MKETEINKIINRELRSQGFSHKISDYGGQFHGESPFDGFAVTKEGFIYWEAKYMNKLQAFNFGKIENHQLDNMNVIRSLQSKAITIYPVGVFQPRKYFYLFLFDSKLIQYLKKSEKKSILKKELTILIGLKKCNIIKRNKISKKYETELKDIRSRIITVDFWKETFPCL